MYSIECWFINVKFVFFLLFLFLYLVLALLFIYFYLIYFFWVCEFGIPNSRFPNLVTDLNFSLYYPLTKELTLHSIACCQDQTLQHWEDDINILYVASKETTIQIDKLENLGNDDKEANPEFGEKVFMLDNDNYFECPDMKKEAKHYSRDILEVLHEKFVWENQWLNVREVVFLVMCQTIF